MYYKLLICIIASLGAGVGTGFAGMSAAMYITPILVTFLNVPTYDAVGIALMSDVLASTISSVTYVRHGNTDIKNARSFMAAILIFTVIGSGAAYIFSSTSTGNNILGGWSIIASLLFGIDFLRKPERNNGSRQLKSALSVRVLIIAIGIYIGFVCGFQGAGGGLLMLFAFTAVMKYNYKSAVGTSVFIMSFTALIGGIAHFIMNGLPDLFELFVCVVATGIFAYAAAQIANRKSERFLGLAIGFMLTISGIVMLIVKYLL